MLIWQIVKGTRVRVWRGQWWTARYRSSSSIAPKDRRRTRCWKLCVTVAISHPVVEYICTLDIDRCARTQSDIARPRVSTRHASRDPYQGLSRDLRELRDVEKSKKKIHTCLSPWNWSFVLFEVCGCR